LQNQIVQTETTGLHEMKVYNQLRDSLWLYLDSMRIANDVAIIRRDIVSLQNVLQRSHTLWLEIDKAFEAKYKKLKITGQKIYSGGLLEKAAALSKYITYLDYIDRTLPPELENDEEFEKIQELPKGRRMYAVADAVTKIVQEAEEIWGESAVRAGLNLPITAREERSTFFRHNGKTANSGKRWGL